MSRRFECALRPDPLGQALIKLYTMRLLRRRVSKPHAAGVILTIAPPNKEFACSAYGYDVGVRLATEFLRRSNFYFNIWLASGDEDYRFGENNDAIADVLDFVDWMLTLDVDSRAYARAKELRELFPVNPS